MFPFLRRISCSGIHSALTLFHSRPPSGGGGSGYRVVFSVEYRRNPYFFFLYYLFSYVAFPLSHLFPASVLKATSRRLVAFKPCSILSSVVRSKPTTLDFLLDRGLERSFPAFLKIAAIELHLNLAAYNLAVAYLSM